MVKTPILVKTEDVVDESPMSVLVEVNQELGGVAITTIPGEYETPGEFGIGLEFLIKAHELEQRQDEIFNFIPLPREGALRLAKALYDAAKELSL